MFEQMSVISLELTSVIVYVGRPALGTKGLASGRNPGRLRGGLPPPFWVGVAKAEDFVGLVSI